MKTLFSILLGLLLLVGVSPEGISGQTAPKINGGVVNGKATSLPKPVYPEALRNAGVEATVAVTVVIDEYGNVISAEADQNDQRVRKADDGTLLEAVAVDPQLRESAEAAARAAKFAPTTLSKVPVQVTGKIVYNFVARTQMDSDERTVSGGVLNGKATSLPLPDYPPAAKAVKAAGAVNVQILIDGEGNVVSASVVSGHPLLRQAAETAAMQAKFSPTQLNGQAVKVSGVLTYNFVP